MTIDEMTKVLTKISSQCFETKILNVILTQYNEIKNLEKRVEGLEAKVNEIIENWNTEIEGENAEALNSEIEEDNSQEEPIVEDTGAAISQEVE